MWKVLLVEDELFVRRKLLKLVNWEEQGFTVAGEASDGQEALELMQLLRPDLVITDILMPRMDGLELLQEARQAGLDSRFIMLTCMGEFEYARKALEYGASGYLLKLSLGIPELEALLVKTGKEIAAGRAQKQALLQRDFDRRYNRIWESITTGNSALDISAGPASFEWVFLAVCFGTETPLLPEVLEEGGLSMPAASWADSFTADGMTTAFLWSERKWSPKTDALRLLPMNGMYNGPVDSARLGIEWRLLLSRMKDRWYDPQAGLIEAKLSMPGQPAVGPEGKQASSPPSFWVLEKEAILAFEQVRLAELRAALTSYWEALQNNLMPFQQVWETARRLARIFSDIAGEPGFKRNDIHPEVFRSHNELLRELLTRTEALLTRMVEAGTATTDHPEINRVLLYIHHHYAENVSLKGMARLVAMEEHYLSRLFKQKTGNSLINYLQQVRVRKAELLLRETYLPVYEIGRNVGFPSENYFVRTFKRWSGRTPGAYRKEKTEEETNPQAGFHSADLEPLS